MSNEKISENRTADTEESTVTERLRNAPPFAVVFIVALVVVSLMFAVGFGPSAILMIVITVILLAGAVALSFHYGPGFFRKIRESNKEQEERVNGEEEEEEEKSSRQNGSRRHPHNRTPSADGGDSDDSNYNIETINPEDIEEDFSSVAGNEAAVQDLQEIKDFLRNPEEYTRRGAKIPKGVLLFGPPGTGKTLSARALAKEAEVPFIALGGSDFVNKYVGVGADHIRALFEAAADAAVEAMNGFADEDILYKIKIPDSVELPEELFQDPDEKVGIPSAIVFIDEIENVGRTREGSGGGSQEYEHALGQLLVEMDGFKHRDKNIIVIGATNREDMLDPALLRPGRMDRKIEVERPDLVQREAILEVHAKGKLISKSVDIKTLAKRTPGFTGADLANLINEAILLSARKKKEDADMDDFTEAMDIVIAGHERKTLLLSDEEKELIAYHEMGHTLAAERHKFGDPVQKVTSIPRGKSLGHTLALPERDKHLHRKEELMARMVMLMGGRAAEQLKFNGILTSGAGNDLAKARETATRMVRELAMTDDLGPNVYPAKSNYPGLDYDPETTRQFEEQINKLMAEAMEEAKKLLEDNKELLEVCVERLMEVETLEREELLKIIEDYREGSKKPAIA